MLTPRFTLSQDEKSVHVIIRVPFAKVSETEVEILDNELHFYSKPYHLRLYFTGDVVEDGLETDYNSSEASFDIRVQKKISGTRFNDLEMITKLLTPPGSWKFGGPSIEELDSGFDTPAFEDAEFDWRFPQKNVSEENEEKNKTALHKYGFGLQQHGVFSALTEELRLVLDIKDVDSLTTEEVRVARETMEGEAFDEDHYLADLFYNDEIQEILDYKPWWNTVQNVQNVQVKDVQNVQVEDSQFFTEEELDVLKELPRQHFNLTQEALPFTWSTLAELIFGYAYDHRTTFGSPTVESSWTVAKLSPTLSCLDSFPSTKEALLASSRRSLIFPLFRNFELASKIVKDVKDIFSHGKRAILKCLLAIRRLFAGTQENRYILNDLYIISYCVWIQTVDESAVEEKCEEMKRVTFQKDELNLDLVDTETAAFLVMKDPTFVNGKTIPKVDLADVMAGLTVDSDDDYDNDDVGE